MSRNAIYSLQKGTFQPGLLATFYTFNQGSEGSFKDSFGTGCSFQDLTFRTPDESRVDATVNYQACCQT